MDWEDLVSAVMGRPDEPIEFNLEALRAAIDTLSPTERSVIYERFSAEKPTREIIGKRLNLTIGRVRQDEERALRKLRRLYKTFIVGVEFVPDKEKERIGGMESIAKQNHASVMQLIETIKQYEKASSSLYGVIDELQNVIPESISPAQYAKLISLLTMLMHTVTRKENLKGSLEIWVRQYSAGWKREDASGK